MKNFTLWIKNKWISNKGWFIILSISTLGIMGSFIVLIISAMTNLDIIYLSIYLISISIFLPILALIVTLVSFFIRLIIKAFNNNDFIHKKIGGSIGRMFEEYKWFFMVPTIIYLVFFGVSTLRLYNIWPFHQNLVFYPLICEESLFGSMHEIEDCPIESRMPATRLYCKPILSLQQVIVWSPDGISPMTLKDCSILNTKNWSCYEAANSREIISVNNGNLSGQSSFGSDAQMVSKDEWFKSLCAKLNNNQKCGFHKLLFMTWEDINLYKEIDKTDLDN